MRDTLWREIESELEKNADSIDSGFIDRRINELCELEARRSGLRPPEITEARINAVINRITARTHRKKTAMRIHPFIRLAAAACVALVFVFFSLFASRYFYTQATERNFSKATLCCGTDYCECLIKKE
jgi:hypothetical protein